MRALIAFAFVAFSAFSAVSVASAVSAVPAVSAVSQTAAGDISRGKELYLKYSCYACHGYDGHGGAGARLVPLAMNETRFAAYVRNPRQMPPYTEKVLADAQLADLFAYIKSLPASPSVEQIPMLNRIISGK
jgi:mono/diheme cytochrome c family protein